MSQEGYLINKNLKLDGAVEIIRYIASLGIGVTASFIYGFPEETEDDLSKTLTVISELIPIRNVNLQAHLCTFLPGTELTEKYLSDMKPVEQYSDITGNIAVDECRDIIGAHPEMFYHMQEYRSELRTKLRYFKMFVFMWKYMQPVYQYISGKYAKERLIEMYFDFAQSNGEILYEIKDMPVSEWLPILVRNDVFVKRFAEDEYYDIIEDFYRMRIAETSDEIKSGGCVTDVYCFSPKDRTRCKNLTDYERRVSVVTFQREKNSNTIRYIVKNC